MTVAQLIECVMGKIGCIKGSEFDGTPFEDFDINKICDEMEKYGFERSGKEILYNGMTGERMNVEVFIGPTYYQRLNLLGQVNIQKYLLVILIS